MKWQAEKSLIVVEAIKHGVDPRFVMAIREQEDGRTGREFGVLSVSTLTYPDQLRVCCNTVARHLANYDETEPLFDYVDAEIRYCDKFIDHFAAIWAPTRVANDPTNLNSNWPNNVIKLYKEICSLWK